MKKILIIDDDIIFQADWKASLEDKATVISAYNLEQAEKLFAQNPDCDIIAVDACLTSRGKPDTIPLVVEIRKNFKGRMIAISSNLEYNVSLVQAGCDHECDKSKVVETLEYILGLY